MQAHYATIAFQIQDAKIQQFFKLAQKKQHYPTNSPLRRTVSFSRHRSKAIGFNP